MINKHPKTIIFILIALAIILIGTVLLVIKQNKDKDKELSEVVEMMTYEKEKVAQEFQDLTFEFDGYSSNIRNDSLLKRLDQEKLHVQDLLEELRTTKATNARRIQELKDELSSIRKVMQHLVMQIDSLNQENTALKSENKEIKRKFEQTSAKADKLEKEKDNLTEVVTRASKLEVAGFAVSKLNSKMKKTTWFSKLAVLQFDFTVVKNITAQPGKRILYLRITRPDYEVLTKDNNDLFTFENRKIAYSAKKEIDYGGEDLKETLYWKVEEIVMEGNYRAEFFADGNLVGSFVFNIKK